MMIQDVTEIRSGELLKNNQRFVYTNT
ncbi:hypothetical protein OCT59_012929 [Rhizophagus irregularis]|nr:hypothetical protein OCT59_012929 [Rhizophagus irregularis]